MRKTKICHFTTGHDAHDARIFQKQCRTLSASGYDVHLVVPVGESEVIENVSIWSAGTKHYSRLVRIFYKGRAVYKIARAVDADIYHFHDPELIRFGIKLKKIGKKVIYDSHEDTPADILNKDWIPRFLRKLVSKLYAKYEAGAARRFDAVVSVTPHVVERFKCVNSNSHLITNYPIVDELPPLGTPATDERQKNICFVGRVCAESMQKNIIEAMSEVDGIRYVLAGPADNEYLDELKALNGWDRCEYHGPIKFSAAPEFVSRAIAGLQVTDYIANFGYNIGSLGNTKMFTYMMAGLPVICTDMVLWQQLIDENDCGLCVNPRNTSEIASAIKFMRDNPVRAAEMGMNGRKAVVEKFNWSTQVPVLLALYASLANAVC